MTERQPPASLWLLLLLVTPSLASPPLWEGCKYTQSNRDQALLRGIQFLKKESKVNFVQHARDYMLGFNLLSHASSNEDVRTMARQTGEQLAKVWKASHWEFPSEVDVDKLRMLTGDVFNAERLGVPHEEFKAHLKTSIHKYTFVDFFGFDPKTQPPPTLHTPRFTSRWETWQNALIFAYVCDQLSFDIGGNYTDVLKWLPEMKPYARPHEHHYIPTLSAIFQIVYTLSDYEHLALDPKLFPDEIEFLREAIHVSIDQFGSIEATGELLDTLKSFGFKDDDPDIQKGTLYLLDAQNADGTWGGSQEIEFGLTYHTTIVAMWGLRVAETRGSGPIHHDALMPLLEEMARDHKPRSPDEVKLPPFGTGASSMEQQQQQQQQQGTYEQQMQQYQLQMQQYQLQMQQYQTQVQQLYGMQQNPYGMQPQQMPGMMPPMQGAPSVPGMMPGMGNPMMPVYQNPMQGLTLDSRFAPPDESGFHQNLYSNPNWVNQHAFGIPGQPMGPPATMGIPPQQAQTVEDTPK